MSHRVGQHVVHFVAESAAEKVLGHMEVAVLLVAHLHLIVDRLTGLLIVRQPLHPGGVRVEVLHLASFAVLEEIGSEQISAGDRREIKSEAKRVLEERQVSFCGGVIMIAAFLELIYGPQTW